MGEAGVVPPAALCRRDDPDVTLAVADAGLATINTVRLAADVLAAGTGPEPGPGLVVVLNRFDPRNDLHRRNRTWLAEQDGLSVVTVPGEEALLRRCVAG